MKSFKSFPSPQISKTWHLSRNPHFSTIPTVPLMHPYQPDITFERNQFHSNAIPKPIKIK